ncbi:MAG: ABC transporter ATP-binding protein [Armatimonadetes bacterium]|nr:ABC transporter ATP-binding protein [Armatimonadota bacterium]
MRNSHVISSPILDLRGIYKSYGGTLHSTPVLKGLDLRVSEGESVAIVGPSGSGKSTLLHIIGTLDTPDKGEVYFNGRDLTGVSASELPRIRNQEIGFIFQLHHLLPQCNVLENVLIPTLAGDAQTREPVQARAIRLLQRVGLGSRLKHRPGQLSGGERQRVAVVRALINEPRLLLADEPTGALDRTSAENLTDMLLELNREEGVTLLVITHSTTLAKQMSRSLEIQDGRLVELEAGV